MNPIRSLKAWMIRKHERCCTRPAGTFGPDDQGCQAGCTCPAEITDGTVADYRRLARKIHLDPRHPHPGTPEDCASPHDVLCKAVWP